MKLNALVALGSILAMALTSPLPALAGKTTTTAPTLLAECASDCSANTLVSFKGAGFKAGANLAIDVVGTAYSVNVTVLSNGTIVSDIYLDSSLPAGSHNVTAANTTGKQTMVTTTTLLVP